jgi:hypothetical protein
MTVRPYDKITLSLDPRSRKRRGTVEGELHADFAALGTVVQHFLLHFALV